MNVVHRNSKLETRNSKLRVGIFGGSGYGGAELLRLLLMHPHAEIALVTANEHAGRAVGDVHRNLYGQAIDVVPRLPRGPKVIDLSGDFRLRDRETFEHFYGREHTAMGAQGEFV